jgi:hypothetical protein
VALTRVNQVGRYGVNRDLSQHEIPINIWTNANNIRFVDGMAAQVAGYKDLYPSPAVTPFHVMPVDVTGVRTWIYAGQNKIYTVINGGTHTNITRQTTGVDVNYNAVRNGWTSSVLGGIPILNNPADTPQQWLLTGKCTALTNWPANTFAKSMRTYKNSLIALNITKTSTNYPYMVKWSQRKRVQFHQHGISPTPQKMRASMICPRGTTLLLTVCRYAIRSSFTSNRQFGEWTTRVAF